jgi:hypothetical protein
MNEILIYKAEASVEGLAEKIRSNSSILYEMPLEPLQNSHIDRTIALLGSEVNIDATDLFLVKSVLVTTNWNKNDDVFGIEPTWAARHTPVHKPTNIEHDEKALIGHIVDTWTINNDGNNIPNDTAVDDLPNLFHVCTASVIYRNWSDPELKERVENLISKIQADEMFVSMECLFTGFDYAVIDENNKSFVIARAEDTAFLTKHLRAYGGPGTFKGHKIGRLLKNITFSGKGFVAKPANPNSIIFTDVPIFDFGCASRKNPFIGDSGVLINEQPSAAVAISNNEEKSDMSAELELLKAQLAETKAALDEATTAKAAADKKLAEAGVAQYETQIAELKTAIEAASKQADADKKSVEEAQSRIDELTAKVDELEKANKELQTTITKVEKEKMMTARVATLVDGGFSKEEAESKVAKFESLDDEQFSVIAETLIDAVKATNQTDTDDNNEEKTESTDSKESDEETDEAEANADEEVLEKTESSEEVAGATEETKSEEDEVEKGRKAIAKYLSNAYLQFGEVPSDDESEE